MNKVFCLVCQNAFDPQRGHQCVPSQSIPKSFQSKNAQLPTKEQENDRERHLVFPEAGKQSNYPNSVTDELENAKINYSARTDIKDMQTTSDFQLSQKSEKMKQQFTVCNSVQTSTQESAKRKIDVLARSLNHPLSIAGYDLPLDLSTRKSPVIVDNCGTSNIKTQFRNIEESLMNNSENNNPEFTMASTDINSMVINKTGSEYLSKRQQQRSNVKMDHILSKNCQDRNEERNLNTEFKSKIIVRNNEMVPKETRRYEMDHQFSVYRHIGHDGVQGNDLENSSDHASIKVKSPEQQLKSSNMSTQKAKRDCTVTQSLNSNKNEMTFSDQINQGHQKQIAPAEILSSDTAESIQSYLKDAIPAVIGPSYSMANESTCSVCRKTFSSKYYLKQHHLIHSGERPFICNICQQKFTQKSSLNQHVRLIHVRKKQQCYMCRRSFATKSAFETHIAIHRRGKHNKCDICEKIFARKDALNIHIRTHTGEKPYKCDVCKRTFAQGPNLLDHVKRWHKVT